MRQPSFTPANHCGGLVSLGVSFGFLYRSLDCPKAARRVLIALLVIHSGLLAYSGYVHSPTFNEPGHLVAGLSHWEHGRFELYRVNPPLVRLIAALPVLAVGYEEDWSGFYEGDGARPVFGMGKDFIAANKERSLFLLMLARWACMPFSWLGAVICYQWGRDLYGRPSGLLACALWCFSPTILAHASLITADAPAGAFGVAACYAFWRWLKRPVGAEVVTAGVMLGLAALSKTTLVLLYPLWPLLWLTYRWQGRAATAATRWLREAGMLILGIAISLYVLNIGYGFDSTLLPLREYRFVSQLFGGFGENQVSQMQSAVSENVASTGGWLQSVPLPFPKQYILGIDIQQRDFEHAGRSSYLRGEWSEQGWWYYYMYAALIKMPLGFWVLALIALLSRLLDHGAAASAGMKDSLILVSPGILLFVTVSMKTGINDHFRYALPALPFAFIWVGKLARNASPLARDHATGIATGWGLCSYRCLAPVRAAAVCWIVASSLWVFPHSLSYFNELVGGPLFGPRHLLGSNVDWGQDLRYLEQWIDEHPSIRLLRDGSYNLYHQADIITGLQVVYPSDLDGAEVGFVAASVNYLAPRPGGGSMPLHSAIGSTPDGRGRVVGNVAYSLKVVLVE